MRHFDGSPNILETINRAEFDKHLDENNERRQNELQLREEEQARIEQLITRYELTLDEMEAALSSKDEPSIYPTLIRNRLQELAIKTAEMATSL